MKKDTWMVCGYFAHDWRTRVERIVNVAIVGATRLIALWTVSYENMANTAIYNTIFVILIFPFVGQSILC